MSRYLLAEPVVITGVGLIASVGRTREEVWSALRRGQSGIRLVNDLDGLPGVDFCAATVDMPSPHKGRLKAITLTEHAADEAVADAKLDWSTIDRERCACSINGIMGDTHCINVFTGHEPADPTRFPWWQQFLPNSMCSIIGDRYGLCGPRLSHSTACASSLISFLTAVRAIRDNQCDLAVCGGGDAIHPLFAAGFRQMRALAESNDPATACKPYDRQRNGFVLGEGAGVFVIERLGHALRRGAKIYAEVTAGKMLAEAHHVTGLDADSDSLAKLIHLTLDKAGLAPGDVGYVNSHGTGTQQNDLTEMRGIQRAFGADLPKVCVSATKSMLGHSVNGSGAVELAVTTLAMRDGFAPPTMNHTDPDPECRFDCLPMRGRVNRFQHALKLSVAFGGHLVSVALSRWNDAHHGFAYPDAHWLTADSERRAA
ncbi:MAG TPA: beta-ketoacyl-[acyl-carrier-protein] synthase family protein [Pirellulaceae bacterium]|nr:beta-ketoacyl-[acyl-carrier-protein] synthase family protein [Pirellulaceae bacterium]